MFGYGCEGQVRQSRQVSCCPRFRHASAKERSPGRMRQRPKRFIKVSGVQVSLLNKCQQVSSRVMHLPLANPPIVRSSHDDRSTQSFRLSERLV